MPQHRLDMLRSGVNVSHWFRQPPSKDPDKLRNYIPDGEMAFMKDMGIHHVRLPVDLRLIMAEDGTLYPRMANYVEDAIHRFNEHDLAVVLTFTNEDRRKTEGNEIYMSRFDKFWKNAATRFGVNDPEMLYFEVLSEPEYVGKEQLWIRYQDALVRTIRRAAPQHTIIIMGPLGGGLAGFHKLHKMQDLNIVYSFHFYEPFLTAQQAALKQAAIARTSAAATSKGPSARPVRQQDPPDYYLTRKGGPGRAPAAYAPPVPPSAYKTVPPYGDPAWGRYQLWSRVDYPIWWGAENKVPIYCGAFGISQKSATSDKRTLWYDALRQTFSANKTGWAVWSWDEGYGLYHQHYGEKVLVDQSVALGLGLKTELMSLEQAK